MATTNEPASPSQSLKLAVQLTGEFAIRNNRAAVWDFLVDPTRIGACGPGVELVRALDDDRFEAVARVGIGLFKARFTVNGRFLERLPPESAVIGVSASAPGSAVDGRATFALIEEAPDRTTLRWGIDLTFGGVVASIGARMIESTANRLIAETFECVRARLEQQPKDGE